MAILKTGVKHKKMSHLQREILRKLCKENLSKTSLQKQLNRHYSDINDAVNILIDKNFIRKINEKKGIGKPEKFYGISTDKIEEILEEELGLEEFWNLIFLFVENNARNLDSVISEIFKNYEKKYFGFSKDLIVPLFDKMISDSNHIKKYSQQYDDTMKILKMLAFEELNSKQIINNCGIPKSKIPRYYNEDNKNPGWINIMSILLLIEKSSKNNSKYRLTSIGIVLLFDGLYNEIKNKSMGEFESEVIIDSVRSKYKDHYPVILKNWDILRKILGDRRLTFFFRQILNFDGIASIRMQNGGLYEFFNTLQSMRITYLNKLDKELEAGRKIWKEFSVKYFEVEKANSLINDAILRRHNWKVKFAESNKWNNILDKIADLTIEVTSLDFTQAQRNNDEEIQNWILKEQMRSKNLENLVTMQFFTLVLHNVKILLNMPLSKSHLKEFPEINEEIYDIQENWNLFLKNNKDYLKLYKYQIGQIVSFENKNIKLIDSLGEFSVESSDVMEQGVDLISTFVSNSHHKQC